MADLMMEDTEWLLEQWAAWSRSNHGVSVSYPKQSPIAQLRQKSSSKGIGISDDEGMLIDGIVARLKTRDNDIYQAVVIYSFAKSNLSHVARKLGINRNRASVLVNAGVAWVDASLVNQRIPTTSDLN